MAFFEIERKYQERGHMMHFRMSSNIQMEMVAYQAGITPWHTYNTPADEKMLSESLDMCMFPVKYQLEAQKAAEKQFKEVMEKALVIGPRDCAGALTAAKSKRFVTVMPGKEFMVGTDTAIVDWKETKQVQALLKKGPWSEIVFAGTLSDSPVSAQCAFLTSLMNVMSTMKVKTPLTVITRGVHAYKNGAATAPSEHDLGGSLIWGLIKSARMEMPGLNINICDVDPSKSLLQLATCPRWEFGQDTAVYHGIWTVPTIVKANMGVSDLLQDPTRKVWVPKRRRKKQYNKDGHMAISA